MKTELEKRWEEEEEEEEAIDEQPLTEEEFMQQEAERMLITNPLVSGRFSPMVLIDAGMRRVIGGILEVDRENHSCSLTYPMEYVEQRVPTGQQDPNGMPIYETKIGVIPMYSPFGAPDYMDFKYTSMYMLPKGKAECLSLVGIYEKTVNGINLARAGLSQPTQEDISKINNARN